MLPFKATVCTEVAHEVIADLSAVDLAGGPRTERPLDEAGQFAQADFPKRLEVQAQGLGRYVSHGGCPF